MQFVQQTQLAKAAPGPYSDYATLITSFKNLVAQYPSLATYETVGKTVQGNEIVIFKIGNPEANTVLIDGDIHGDEALGSELLYFYAQWLLSSNDSLANQILNNTYTLLVPVVNVDSFNVVRVNANHVDLNRNFATNWPNGGSADPSSWSYRGPAPLSEPESQTMVQVFETYKPQFYVNLHAGGGEYYLGSIYGNQTYYQSLTSEINFMSQERNVASYPFYWTDGPGYAISDVAKLGITSFLLELTSNTTMSLPDIKTTILPKFIPIAAVLSQENGLLFEDSFESGTFNAWSGNQTEIGETMSVTGNFSRDGRYSAFFSSDGDETSGAAYCYESLQPQTTVSADGYFAATSFTDTDNGSGFYFAGFEASGENVLMVGVTQNKGAMSWRLAVMNNSNWVTIDSQASGLLGQWHRFKVQWAQSPTDGYGRLYIDDELVYSVSGIDTTAYGAVDSANFGILMVGNAKTVFYLDYVQISAHSLVSLPLPADLNRDGTVDIRDLNILVRLNGASIVSPDWNPIADLNLDGKIGVLDIAYCASYYGKKTI